LENDRLKKGKAIPVTGREGPWGCETSRLPYFLDNQLTDVGEVVSPTRRPPFTPRKIPGTHFCSRLSRPQGHSAAGRVRSIEKSNDIENRTRDVPACSIVPQPTTLPRAPEDLKRNAHLNGSYGETGWIWFGIVSSAGPIYAIAVLVIIANYTYIVSEKAKVVFWHFSYI
jgi:hypothetical protein